MASRFMTAKTGGICLAAGLLIVLWIRFVTPGFAQTQAYLICEIQGSGESSPYINQPVETEGVVHLDLDSTSHKGFFLQQKTCDQDALTSDGIFVYLGEQGDWVETGDHVHVTGTVQEYYGQTEIVSTPSQIVILSSENELPDPIYYEPPQERAAGQQYFESLEGMRIGLDKARVVGPTDSNDRTWVIGDDPEVEHLFLDDSNGLALCVDDGGKAEIAPEAGVGDTLEGLRGTLDFSYGLFCLQLDTEPRLTPVELRPVKAPGGGLRIATFNLKNLFDTQDDPLIEDSVLSENEYTRRLRKRALAIQDVLDAPDLIAVQEVENDAVLDALIARPELTVDYAFLWSNGPDARGIDTALLFRPERMAVLSFKTSQGCTGLIDGLGPDGNGDPVNPVNALTCDRNGDGVLDGNRLFSRPPLVAHFQLPEYSIPDGVWVITNHWKSKSEDTSAVAYTLPRRIEQARFVAEIAVGIQTQHPDANILILGDLNDTLASAPLAELTAGGMMINLWERMPPEERYTYIYQGYSQPLDHILVIGPWLTRVHDGILWAARINADYPARYTNLINTPSGSSDHDPLLVRFNFYTHQSFLPLVSAP